MKSKGVVKGHCNCGQVTFEVRTASPNIYVCHCSICGRATGSIGVTVLVVPTGDFKWTSGEQLLKRWTKPGHDWQCSFCTECGSHLPGENDAKSVYIPAGLINQGQERLKVAHHIWVSSKAPWHHIGDAGEQHEEAKGAVRK